MHSQCHGAGAGKSGAKVRPATAGSEPLGNEELSGPRGDRLDTSGREEFGLSGLRPKAVSVLWNDETLCLSSRAGADKRGVGAGGRIGIRRASRNGVSAPVVMGSRVIQRWTGVVCSPRGHDTWNALEQHPKKAGADMGCNERVFAARGVLR